MAYQNINQYNFNKIGLKPLRQISDISLTSDEKDYDEEVIFSQFVIAEDDGNRMPLKFDFNSTNTTICVGCGEFSADTIVSENVWNPNNLDLENCNTLTELCDVGLTGIDNGLVMNISGETIEINKGLYTNTSDKFSRYKYDSRFKMHPVTGFTTNTNRIYNDGSFNFSLTSKTDGDSVGYYANLNGGFYQGFYKLQGYDYQVLPERYNWGWSAEFLLRNRFNDNSSVGLNVRYPENTGTFFFMGARAENKFYHFADGAVPLVSEINGVWEFYVEDFYGGDSGSIDSLSITICDSNGCHIFPSNQTNITIPDSGPASVYPITFTVSGITDIVTNISLTLVDYFHTYPEDVGMLLVSPTGLPSLISGENGSSITADTITVILNSSATTLWDGYSGGEYLNDTYCYYDLPFSSPCPYQYLYGQSTGNLNIFLEDYNRVTEGLNCLKTCECQFSATSGGSTCINVYPQSATTDNHCTCSCRCNCPTNNVIGDLNPLYDGISNAMSVRLSGNTGNPRLCVKSYRITGGCETTGSCSTTGVTYTTGTSVTEWCSTIGIFDDCKDTSYIDNINWAQIDVVFVRDEYLSTCDLIYKGGLKEIVKTKFIDNLNGNSVALIEPPITHEIPYDPATTEVVNITEHWINEKNYRNGKLKLYVNGKLFFVIENFEEIIPRPLNIEKEKQIGVGYNISLGGGTQGLHDNLTFSGCPDSLSGITLQQDPECLTTETLSNTMYNGLTTNIFLEEYFGGSFIGDISAFRMYTEPLNAAQIKHNFRVLKSKYSLLNPDCPSCVQPIPPVTPSNTPQPTPSNTPTLYLSPTPTGTPSVTPTTTPTITPTPQTTYRAYLFIEPQTGSTNIGQWMFNNSSNFFGFTNESQPSQNQILFNSDMNLYVDYSGWTSGQFPTIIEQIVPQVSGGVDNFDNPIVAYNFKTTEIPANTVGCQSWYTWIIPTTLTNGGKQSEIDFNPTGNPNLLTAVRTEQTIYSYTFYYTGSTIPNTTYRVYTTYPNNIFKLNNTQSIYFRGNSVTP